MQIVDQKIFDSLKAFFNLHYHAKDEANKNEITQFTLLAPFN